jgi:esterase/lipase superfamily enzyme
LTAESAREQLPKKALRLLKALSLCRAIERRQRLLMLTTPLVVIGLAWLLPQDLLKRVPAHYVSSAPAAGGSTELPSLVPDGPKPSPAGVPPPTLDVAVNPVAGCDQPPCNVAFQARVLGASPDSVTFEWSGCARGATSAAACPVNDQQTVVATVTVTSKVTGERVVASATATPRMETVFYGTNRRPERGNAANVHFTGLRNDDSPQPVSLGVRVVAIPPHHLRGGNERPIAIWKYQARENVGEHIVIVDGSPRTPEAFFTDLHDRIEGSPTKDAFIFVHGFRVEFDDAVRQTAQLAWDLKFPGVPILYSWPSGGKVADYVADYDSARLSRIHFARFLQDVQRRSGARTLYVIAHSMGAWALVNSFEEMDRNGAEPGGLHLKELIFAAPDVDQGEFRIAAPRLKRRADRISLYAASQDDALKASRKIRSDYPRAGEAGRSLLVVAGVDTIDASAVTVEGTSLLDHSYFDNTLSVLGDISTLLTSGAPAAQRYGLEGRRLGSLGYWAFIGGTFPYWLVRDLEYVFIGLGLVALVAIVLLILARIVRRFAERILRERYGFAP